MNEIYSSNATTDQNKIKTFYFKFSANKDQKYILDLNYCLSILVSDGKISINQQNFVKSQSPSAIKTIFEKNLNQNASFRYASYEITPEGICSFQLIETDSNGNILDPMPIITVAAHAQDDDGLVPDKIEISNSDNNKSLTIQSTGFYTRPNEHRDKRDFSASQLECVVFPVIAIVNMFMNRPCDIIKSSLNYISGEKNPSGGTNQPATNNNKGKLEWVLSDVVLTGGKDPYIGYAASKKCKAPLEKAFLKRKPRALGSDDCIYKVMSVLTPYLILTGYRDFDATHFNSTIAQILATGTTGLTGLHNDTEHELISAVENIGKNEADSILHNATLPVLRLASSNFTLAQIADGGTPDHPRPSTSGITTTIPVPTESRQSAAIGHYDLYLSEVTLAAFRQNYPQTAPRTYTNNNWVNSSTPFTTEVIANPNQGQLATVRDILNQWYPASTTSGSSSSNNQGANTGNLYTDLLNMGRSLTSSMLLELDEDMDGEGSNRVFVIVRYQGRPAALLYGHVYEDVRSAKITYTLSNPDNIRIPYSNTAIRGSAQEALRQYIEYCINHNIREVGAEAVTEASANLKKKFGFQYDEDGDSHDELKKRSASFPDPDSEIKISENPVKGDKIKFTGKSLKNIKNAKVYNPQGVEIANLSNPFSNKNSIDINPQNPGIYIIILDNKSYKALVSK
nr:T9SS type A sorting domain-containing protein [uncultured Chryseobacterium sp.]